jgi:hypothetical protein
MELHSHFSVDVPFLKLNGYVAIPIASLLGAESHFKLQRSSSMAVFLKISLPVLHAYHI